MRNHSDYEISATKHYERLCYWTRLICWCFQEFLRRYVSQFERVLVNIREKCRLDSSTVDAEEWSTFQNSLRIIQTCGNSTTSSYIPEYHLADYRTNGLSGPHSRTHSASYRPVVILPLLLIYQSII